MRANQLRLWFASMAYGLVTALRRIGLAGTELATQEIGDDAGPQRVSQPSQIPSASHGPNATGAAGGRRLVAGAKVRPAMAETASTKGSACHPSQAPPAANSFASPSPRPSR